MTKRIAIAALLLLAAAARAQTAPAKESEPAAPAPMEVKNAGAPGVAEGVRTVKETVKVTAVDVANRQVTLKDAKGRTETIAVGPQVQRLEEVKAGDALVIEHTIGLALEFQMPNEPSVQPEAAVGGARAGKDQAPGGELAAGIRATVKVTAVDVPNRMVTLQGPNGQYHMVKADPSIRLEALKVGDRLVATYVESVALKIEKAPAKKDASKAKKDEKPKDAKAK